MKIVKMKQENRFAVGHLGFNELKVIKDACKLYAKQGSAVAKKLAEEFETQMDQIEI